MGYGHAPDATLTTSIRTRVGNGGRSRSGSWLAWDSGSWASAGSHNPGRILFPPWSSPASWACCRFSFWSNLETANERYGIYYLQSMLSIFAFSRLRPGCWRGVERSQWIAEWLRVAKRGMIFLVLAGS